MGRRGSEGRLAHNDRDRQVAGRWLFADESTYKERQEFKLDGKKYVDKGPRRGERPQLCQVSRLTITISSSPTSTKAKPPIRTTEAFDGREDA